MSHTRTKETLYEVEKICGKKIKKKEIFYLVKWVGYDESENTWEPEKNLVLAQKILQEYESLNSKLISKNKENKIQGPKTKYVKNKKCRQMEFIEDLITANFNDDVAKKIVECLNPHEKNKNKRKFKVAWNSRIDGSIPKESILGTEEIKANCADILLDFYEDAYNP